MIVFEWSVNIAVDFVRVLYCWRDMSMCLIEWKQIEYNDFDVEKSNSYHDLERRYISFKEKENMIDLEFSIVDQVQELKSRMAEFSLERYAA